MVFFDILFSVGLENGGTCFKQVMHLPLFIFLAFFIHWVSRMVNYLLSSSRILMRKDKMMVNFIEEEEIEDKIENI